MWFADNLAVLAAALAVEAALGYPAPLYRAIGHPVTWMGALLAWLEARLNGQALSSSSRRTLGALSLVLLLMTAGGTGVIVQIVCLRSVWGWGLLALAASSLLAQRSLHEHVAAVATALDKTGLEAGRAAVAKIVGRNPQALDEAGVARAAIESLAENFSDGVVAPAFWMAIGGLAGGALYKAANTADSMIGHRNVRYAAFGWAAARLDDLVNLPASRLAAAWLIAAAAILPHASAAAAVSAVARDARRHRSPNAGWPEAAMAGALGLQLAGPRVYGNDLIEDAFMGDGRRAATAGDIRRALRLYRLACLLQWIIVVLIAFALNRPR